MLKEHWNVIDGNSPIIATAIHDGHNVRDDLKDRFKISSDDRLREEDPYTGLWTQIAKTKIIGNNSRFQVDLNRVREAAVYVKPEDAWGLHVWEKEIEQELINKSLEEYDDFYKMMHVFLSNVEKQFGKFIVLDLHSYNHRRDGINGPHANVLENPEVNIGTGTMNKQIWSPVVERFIHDLSEYDFLGRKLDVRENIKFKGGYFSRWVHENFPNSGCAIAIEFKKFFMDEWSGKLDQTIFNNIHNGLASTIPGLKEELKKI